MKDICRLYFASCPKIVTSEESIIGAIKNAHIIKRFDSNGNLTGAAAVVDNVIALLCVRPDCRRQGIGTALFAECEEYVRSKGYDKRKLFGHAASSTPGGPLYEGNAELFEKLGYINTWGDRECVDMSMSLADFHQSESKLGDSVNGITYKRADQTHRKSVLECMAVAEKGFIRYYDNDRLYSPDSDEFALVALDGDRVAGAILVEAYNKELGSIGCTATHNIYRRRGIATNLAKIATRCLAESGIKSAWLAYTYTDLIPMYAQSGYSVFMKYYMGEKPL